MADQMSGPVTRCQWCSAELPAPDVERCPSCGATLTSATGTEPQLPGVTALDPEAILRARSEATRPRNRILSFLTGEVATDAGRPADPASFAPPSDEVRREMLRLQIEAERADLEAETVALKSDVLAHRGIPLSALGQDEPGTEPAEPDAEPAPSEGTEPKAAPEA